MWLFVSFVSGKEFCNFLKYKCIKLGLFFSIAIESKSRSLINDQSRRIFKNIV